MPQNAASSPALPTAEEIEDVARRFETAAPVEVLRWVGATFGDSVAYACSFQDAVLLDIAAPVLPGLEVVFLDTGAHFPETHEYVEAMRERYGFRLTTTHPGPDAEATPCGAPGCCEMRKVAPLRAALAGKAAWITGLKRSDAPTRAGAPVVAFDAKWGLVKVNPLATWTDVDVAAYEDDHAVPRHPLFAKGYRSIGCAPTTRPTAEGEDPRAGRWSGSDKTECGLHV